MTTTALPECLVCGANGIQEMADGAWQCIPCKAAGSAMVRAVLADLVGAPTAATGYDRWLNHVEVCQQMGIRIADRGTPVSVAEAVRSVASLSPDLTSFSPCPFCGGTGVQILKHAPQGWHCPSCCAHGNGLALAVVIAEASAYSSPDDEHGFRKVRDLARQRSTANR